MGIFDPKNKKAGRAAVQTAPQPRQECWQPRRFLPAEAPLYLALRQSVPLIDAALQKIVRLTVDFTLAAEDPRAQEALPLCGGGAGRRQQRGAHRLCRAVS